MDLPSLDALLALKRTQKLKVAAKDPAVPLSGSWACYFESPLEEPTLFGYKFEFSEDRVFGSFLFDEAVRGAGSGGLSSEIVKAVEAPLHVKMELFRQVWKLSNGN